MIATKDLRVGNLIFWNPKLSNPYTTLGAVQVEVSAILKDKISYIYPGIEYRAEPFEDDLLENEPRYKSLEELEPIILTPDMLETSGFKQVNNYFSRNIFLKNQSGFFLGIDINTADYKVSLRFMDGQKVDLPVPCQFLNQLQNLCFALSGEELEINL